LTVICCRPPCQQQTSFAVFLRQLILVPCPPRFGLPYLLDRIPALGKKLVSSDGAFSQLLNGCVAVVFPDRHSPSAPYRPSLSFRNEELCRALVSDMSGSVNTWHGGETGAVLPLTLTPSTSYIMPPLSSPTRNRPISDLVAITWMPLAPRPPDAYRRLSFHIRVVVLDLSLGDCRTPLCAISFSGSPSARLFSLQEGLPFDLSPPL